MNEINPKLLSRWAHMMNRCYQPKNSDFKNYGGRGIKVCDRWFDYRNFVKDLGDPPAGYSLDRIDNDGDYSPENTRWADKYTQVNNRRSSVKYTYKGETYSIAEWARIKGIKVATLKARLRREEWSIEDALERSVAPPPEEISFNGETRRIQEWADHYGLKSSLIRDRLAKGWSFEKTVTTPVLNETILIEWNGEIKTISEWSKITGILPRTIFDRHKRGVPIDDVFKLPKTTSYTAFGETRRLYEWARTMNVNPLTLQSRLLRGWDIERALTTPVEQSGVTTR